MPITQQCSECAEDLTFEKDAAIDAPVTCANGHAHVVARCPYGACPAKRIAIAAGAKVGAKVYHPPCKQDLVVTSRNPTVLMLA